MAHLRAVPDPDDDPRADVEPVDPAAAVGPDGPVGDLVETSEDEPRRYPSTIGGAFYLAILAAAGTALVIAVSGDWRLGIQVLGSSMIIAALLRLVLAERDAGMLAVRNRYLDTFLLAGPGAALLALATTISDVPVT